MKLLTGQIAVSRYGAKVFGLTPYILCVIIQSVQYVGFGIVAAIGSGFTRHKMVIPRMSGKLKTCDVRFAKRIKTELWTLVPVMAVG